MSLKEPSTIHDRYLFQIRCFLQHGALRGKPRESVAAAVRNHDGLKGERTNFAFICAAPPGEVGDARWLVELIVTNGRRVYSFFFAKRHPKPCVIARL